MSAARLSDLGEKIGDFGTELLGCAGDVCCLGRQMMIAAVYEQTPYQQQKLFALISKVRDELPRVRDGLNKLIETLGNMPRLGP